MVGELIAEKLNLDADDDFDFEDFGLDEYQEEAANFAFYDGIVYPVLGLVGEAVVFISITGLTATTSRAVLLRM